ncbi:anti-sigma factor family protein [Litoreibacter roseus]|uniref:Membrane protein n=1 Tax=Litoreibacter roseus TaxID=2601869 RepID=A0A6N6JCI0_9RHOB|nr:anti-sigma factor [Litoreibacter roseus]GFE63794.1 membrane protein [Litoreibacter roseus]
MTQYEEKLSAFLDGELSAAETQEVERALERDPALQGELEALMAADVAASEQFDAMLHEPVPLELAAAIRNAPDATPANTPRPKSAMGWLTAAAAAVALAVGGVGGYVAGTSQTTQVAEIPGWLADIADYHRVYAGQKRHLVEVPASEAEHIQTWLTGTVGTKVRIPDLTEFGLTFQGARLLVAAGKPVSQLMYTDANENVVALCQIQSDAPGDGFSERTVDAFDMISWGARDAKFVIVGDEGRDNLGAIARSAADQVEA